MNHQPIKSGLRISGLIIVTALCRFSLAQQAYAWGFENTVVLSMNLGPWSYGESGGTVTSDIGPGAHSTTLEYPNDPTQPTTPLFLQTSAIATGSSTASIDYSTELVWDLTNSTELPEQAILTYQGDVVSQSEVGDWLHQYATNTGVVFLYDSISNRYNTIATASTDTLASSLDGSSAGYNGQAMFTIQPNQSIQIIFGHESISYATSTPEPAPIAALALGVLGLLRRRTKRP